MSASSEGSDETARASPPWSLHRTHAAAAVAAALALFFAPALLGSGEFAYRDTGRLHAPTKRWIGEELSAGRFPQWNPYAGLGAPVIGNGVDAPQHPFNLLLVVLPAALALKAWILASFALAAAGAYAWARQAGASHEGSALAAIAFALSGPLVSSSDNVQYLTTYAALPLVLTAGHAFAARGGPTRLALVALASALCAAAGDPQSWAIVVALLPPYALAVAEDGQGARALRRGLQAAAAALLAAAPFVLPVLEWMGESSRTGGLPPDEAVKWAVHPLRYLELVVPELFRGDPADPLAPAFAAYVGNDVTTIPWFLSLYVGAGVTALATLAVARVRRARWLALAALPIAWAATGHYLGFRAVAAHLPLLGSLRYWEKVTVFIPLVAAILAARGLDAARDRVGVRGLSRGSGAAALLLLAVAAIAATFPGAIPAPAGGPGRAATDLAANLASGAWRAGAVLALVALLAARADRGTSPRLVPIALGLVAAFDLVGGNVGAYVLSRPTPADPPPLARPLRPGDRVLAPFAARQDRWPGVDRVANTWEWCRRTLDASWNVPLHLGSARDYQGLRQQRWERHRKALGDGLLLARLGLFGFTHVAVPGDPSLAARAGLSPPFRVVAEDPELPAWLVELPHRPRAYLAGRLDFSTADEALAFALDGGGDGRSVLEGPIPPGYFPPAGTAEIARDVAGDTAVEATASHRALLVLNDAHAPGWTATVDGAPSPIVRVNALVRGVWIEAGAHSIRFTYRTPGLAAGWALALGLGLGLGAWRLAQLRTGRPAAER
jgi:hypothetical protein